MISTDQLQQVVGSTAVGSDGDKIGTVGQVYLDNETGQPEWVTVKTGLLGSSESFVPLQGADLSGDGLRLPFDKEKVKGAPNLDVDQQLSESEEQELYRYYGPAAGGRTAGDYDTTGQDATGTTDTGYAGGRDTVGRDTSGPTTDDAMTRSEERVRAGTETVEAGRARLRKYVVTEQQQVTVPVSREEVRLERESITDANRGDALSGPDLSEEEHEVTLTEERPVIQKETVPVERVRLAKDTVTDEQAVDVDVRQERIETDTDGRTGVDSDVSRDR